MGAKRGRPTIPGHHRARYNRGCRCAVCKAAQAAYARARRPDPPPTLLEPRCAEVITRLASSRMGRMALAELARVLARP
jgi:hypothetical protein